ncbi:MAG TPA: transketolase C-terminal domain-containing protein, partial [Bacteroidia bacterium]|nr:transketolase C-terminal domain-containing protein [Bacteroidia bacterium]
QELRNMMYTAQLEKNALPFSIRYPRGNGVMVNWKTPFEEIEIGKGRKLKDGKDVAILSIGHIGNTATEAIKIIEEQSISVAHYDMRFVKPLDEQMLHEIFTTHKKVITIEDGCLHGGFGSAVVEFMSDNNYHAQVKRLGIPDEFIEHGEPKELYDEVGLSATAIAAEVIKLIAPAQKIMIS